MNHIQTDVLVLGAGLAGLEAAWVAAKKGLKVTLLSKGASASPWVLGFNAPVGANDSIARYCEDTLQGGWNLGDPALVSEIASGSLETIDQMRSLGQDFDQTDHGYHLLQPLGCSVPRLVHTQNRTGLHSLHALRAALSEMNVTLLEPYMATELLVQDGKVRGAAAVQMDAPNALLAEAGAVVLATGGSHLMYHSTYPLCQTADGFSMAYGAGATLTDMEFVQFEPCRAVWPKPLGISTTLLAKGGKLFNCRGERFILNSYPAEGAVPKDVLARLIALEIAAGNATEHGGVYLDLTDVPEDEIKVNHKLYYERFINEGIDLTKERVEVGPSAHSMMGGVQIDPGAWTGVDGLYAAGEVTGGIHGANRLGGNAGAEIYVMGRIAGHSAAHAVLGQNRNQRLKEATLQTAWQKLQPPPSGNTGKEAFDALHEALLKQMAASAGAVRTADSVFRGLDEIKRLQSQTAALRPNGFPALLRRLEVLHLAETGALVCAAALARTESRGVHYRADFPGLDDAQWRRHICFSKQTGNSPVLKGVHP